MNVPTIEEIREAMLRKRHERNYSIVRGILQKSQDKAGALEAVRKTCPKFLQEELDGLASILVDEETKKPKKGGGK